MDVAEVVQPDELRNLAGRNVLITGAGGMLGLAFREILEHAVADCRVIACDRQALDVTRRSAVLAMAKWRPDVILHCAANVNADHCERNPTECRAVQVGGTENIIALAHCTGARVVYPQSVFIFDGRELPVTEQTVPRPMSVYGRYKLEAESRLMEACPNTLVVRMAGFFGGGRRDKNFVGSFTRALFEQLARGERRCRVGTRLWQPTYTRDLAANTLLLVARGGAGVYHMGANGEASFYDVARACVEELGLGDLVEIAASPRSEVASTEIAPRPQRIVTANQRLRQEGVDRQRPWRDALREYMALPYFRDRAAAALLGTA
jgi:dTDP-4-dehydrorhamnose reductase